MRRATGNTSRNVCDREKPMKTTLLLGVCALTTLASVEALADDKAACLDAASEGQTLRDAHKLVEARNQFLVCARQECPSVVRKDCTTWVEQAQSSLPTVVPTATDEVGNSLPSVKVSMDGKVLLERADGRAVEVNPGTHTFTFEAADGTKTDLQVAVAEGQKNERIAATIGKQKAAAVLAPPPAFTSAAPRSNRPDDAAEAKRRQGALEPSLTRIVVHAPRDIVGLVVKLDGRDLPPAAWDTPIPVDPGPHTIRAEASGRIGWTHSVTASGAGQTTTVDVPALNVAPMAVAATVGTMPTAESASRPTSVPSGPEEHSASSSGSTAAGWALIGLGASVGVGGCVLMLVEAGRTSSARADDNQSSYNSAKAPWTVGLTGAISGGAAAIVGVVLLATSHDAVRTSKWSVSPWVGSGVGGIQCGGTWQ